MLQYCPYLSQQEPMGDVLRQHEARDQVMNRACLPTVGPEHKGIEVASPMQVSQIR